MAVWCSSSRSTGGTVLHGELQHERCGESTGGLDEPALVRGFSILLSTCVWPQLASLLRGWMLAVRAAACCSPTSTC
jgi:hypothetical protein